MKVKKLVREGGKYVEQYVDRGPGKAIPRGTRLGALQATGRKNPSGAGAHS